jgi:hypothetical protein
LPLQDAKKVRLLCNDCEELFSGYEKIFAEKVFIPYHDQGVRSFDYGPWLLKFAVSLVWRAIAKENGSGWEAEPEMGAQVEEAAQVWADFLLGKRADTAPYEHHFVLWDPQTMGMSGEVEKVPDHVFWYILRHLDATTIWSDKTKVLYGYSKLPQMLFFSGINPKKPANIKGTLIKKKVGTIGLNQVIRNIDFGQFLAGRVKEYRSYMGKMSDTQRSRIEEKMLANPEKSINSKSFETFLVEQAFRDWKNQAGNL